MILSIFDAVRALAGPRATGPAREVHTPGDHECDVALPFA